MKIDKDRAIGKIIPLKNKTFNDSEYLEGLNDMFDYLLKEEIEPLNEALKESDNENEEYQDEIRNLENERDKFERLLEESIEELENHEENNTYKGDQYNYDCMIIALKEILKDHSCTAVTEHLNKLQNYDHA